MSGSNHKDAAKFNSLVYKGLSMLEKGKYYKAASLFNKAMQINPNDEDAKNLREKALRYLSTSEKKKLLGDNIIQIETKEKQKVRLGEKVSEIEEKVKVKVEDDYICDNCGEPVDPSKNICMRCGAFNDPIQKFLARKAFDESGAYVIVQVEKTPFTGMDPNGPFNEGLKLLEQMELKKASEYFDTAIDSNPNNEMLWNNLGVACMGLTDRRGALMCYWKAVKINSKYYIGLYNIGAVYYECKQYKEAIKYYDEALESNPNCAEAFQDRKLAYEGMSEEEISMLGEEEHTKLRKKVYSDPLNTRGLNLLRAQMNLSSALVDLGNGNDAILGSYKKILKNSKQIKELFEKGQELVRNGEIEKAIHYFDEGLKLNPQDAVVWTGKGFTLSLIKKIDEALECFNEATKLDPNHELAWLYKGVTLAVQSKFKEAIACYNQVLRINPFNEDAKLGKEGVKK